MVLFSKCRTTWSSGTIGNTNAGILNLFRTPGWYIDLRSEACKCLKILELSWVDYSVPLVEHATMPSPIVAGTPISRLNLLISLDRASNQQGPHAFPAAQSDCWGSLCPVPEKCRYKAVTKQLQWIHWFVHVSATIFWEHLAASPTSRQHSATKVLWNFALDCFDAVNLVCHAKLWTNTYDDTTRAGSSNVPSKSKNAGTQHAHQNVAAYPLSDFHVYTHPASELLDVLTVVGGLSLPSACDKEAAETQHLLLF